SVALDGGELAEHEQGMPQDGDGVAVAADRRRRRPVNLPEAIGQRGDWNIDARLAGGPIDHGAMLHPFVEYCKGLAAQRHSRAERVIEVTFPDAGKVAEGCNNSGIARGRDKRRKRPSDFEIGETMEHSPLPGSGS